MNIIKQHWQPFLLYFLLISGGIWNATGLFSGLMYNLAAPVIMLLGVLITISMVQGVRSKSLFYLWVTSIAILSFGIE